MSNIFTPTLQATLFNAARRVPRELTGVLGAITRDWNDQGVAQGDSVKISISPVQTVTTITPGATFPSGTDRTASSAQLTLNQTAETSWNLTAEQERGLQNAGVAADFLAQTVQQGIRAVINQIESYVWGVCRAGASRAYGTAGTAPFGTTVADAAQVRKILVDNGIGLIDTSLIIDTNAGVSLRSLSNLFKVNEGGSEDLLRQGVIGNLFGMGVRESAAVIPKTKGGGTSYTSDTAGYAVGATTINLITGSGTILAGDVITFAGDANKYVVKTGLAGPGALVLQEPGLKVALAASAVALTVGNNATANLAIERNAAIAVIRPALQPDGAIAEQMVVTDEVTGLSMLLLRVPQNAQSSWFLRCVYDAFVPNGYAIAQLLG